MQQLFQFARHFDNRVRGVVVRFGVEQGAHIVQHWRPVKQCQEEWIVIENVEKAGALCAHDPRQAGVGDTIGLRLTPLGHDAIQRPLQSRHVVAVQKIFQHQIAIDLKEKTLGRRNALGRRHSRSWGNNHWFLFSFGWVGMG